MTQTLTTERLREIVEDGFLEHGDAKSMARELLANREAQPVGYIAEVSGNRVGALRGLPLPDVGSLIYTAPPAPVVNPEFTGATAVPEEMTKEDAMEFIIFRPPFKSSVDCVQVTWNACRAAMLAAAPEGGNEK
ncbi:hypothetical protein [Serratia marcescens]|uniref:hypothetical protein n=1 Tax=Serratia marcescens TaxID=615 RepID=UPI0029D60446|nr:hypothetical protein [Serratia marcescens]MDX7490209.1 hypothetical protein [Serratia marcescens]